MSSTLPEPMSKLLVSYIKQSTFDLLEAYCVENQRGRDVIVEMALSVYLNGQASGELAHLRNVVEMQQAEIERLLGTHDQP